MAYSNASFDGEAAVTLSAWMAKELVDQFTSNMPIFMKLRQSGNMKKGGNGINYVVPIMFPTLTGPQIEDITNPYDDVTAQMTDNMTALQYTRCEKAIDISVPLYNIENQGSDTEKVNLIEATTKISMNKFTENLNLNLWANPETASNIGSRGKLASLRALINGGGSSTTDGGATPAALASQGNKSVSQTTSTLPQFTIGGVNRNAAGAAYHCSQVFNTSENLTVQTFSRPYSQTIRGTDHVDLVMVHPDVFDRIMSLATLGGSNGGQFYNDSEMLKLGFDAIRFRGADIVADHNVPTSGFVGGTSTATNYQLFYINSKYLQLVYETMKPNVRIVPEARELKRWRARWTGQLIGLNLGRVHAVHANMGLS